MSIFPAAGSYLATEPKRMKRPHLSQTFAALGALALLMGATGPGARAAEAAGDA